jgi:TPR repeat protein
MRIALPLLLQFLVVTSITGCTKTVEGVCATVPQEFAMSLNRPPSPEQSKFFEKNFLVCKQRKNRRDPNALYSVGVSVLHGLGTEKDPSKAFLWFKGAADKKHNASQKILAEMFMQGVGVVRDPLIAKKYLDVSAHPSQGG